MVSKKAFPIDGTVTIMVVLVVLVPSVLLTPQTAEFRATFLKKCEEFPEKKQICEKILATFEQAYVGKNKNEVSEKNYNQVFAETPFTHPCEKTLLWSGTYEIAHEFAWSSKCFFTLEDTLLGHVLDKLEWCGEKGNKETFTEHCTDVKPNPVSSFWEKASITIGQYACGHVTAMLDGERPAPYFPTTFFALYEVANLQSPKVTQLTVVLVVKEDKGQCNNESLKNLNNILKGKKIVYDCKEVTQSHIKTCVREKKTCGACW
uniref:ADP-ribosyl cyclase/cyclic ADP-ribose hydrolase 1-like n=1 Tax=Semicossyphus pulcher TaxID=241346 RepID=UPI0037E725C8